MVEPTGSRPAVAGWPDWSRRFAWDQGEHLTLLGPTSAGKTHVARLLLPRRDYVVAIATKPRDPLVDRFRADGFKIVRQWPPPPLVDRVLLWPRMRTPDDVLDQRETIRQALADIYVQGGWTVYIDEMSYVTGRPLNLSAELELLWTQGRALGVTVVAATQRPAHVPLVAYSQATHVLAWQTNDDRDVKRLGEIAGPFDRHALGEVVAGLPPHAFAHISTRTGSVTVTRAPAPT